MKSVAFRLLQGCCYATLIVLHSAVEPSHTQGFSMCLRTTWLNDVVPKCASLTHSSADSLPASISSLCVCDLLLCLPLLPTHVC